MSDTNPTTDLTTSKRLGVPSLLFFVLGAAAPLTILAGFVPLGLAVGGEGIVTAFLVPGVVYLVFTVGFAAMSRHFFGEGAFYAYITRGMGRRTGGAAGMATYVGYLLGQMGFTAAAGVFAAQTVTLLTGADISWLVYAIAFTLIVGLLGYRSVHIGARVLGALLVCELGVLVVFCVAVLVQGGHSGLSLSALSPAVVFSASVPALFILTFTAFVGFEQTAIYSREVKDRTRTVSRATYIAVITLTVFYSFCSWAILQAIGPDRMADVLKGDPSALVFTLNSEFAGEAMTTVMELLIVTSFFAGILALQNASARYLHALGSTRMLPSVLSRVSPSTGSPSAGNIVQATLVGVTLVVFAIFGADPYTQVVVWTNSPTIIAVLAMQILTSIAVIRFFRDERHGESVFVRVIAPSIAIVLLTGVLVLLLMEMGLLTGLDALGNSLILLPLVIAAVYGFVRGSLTTSRVVDAVATPQLTLPS